LYKLLKVNILKGVFWKNEKGVYVDTYSLKGVFGKNDKGVYVDTYSLDHENDANNHAKCFYKDKQLQILSFSTWDGILLSRLIYCLMDRMGFC